MKPFLAQTLIIPLASIVGDRYNSAKMKEYHLTAVIWEEGKHYVSKCPEIGVASFGATLEKAKIGRAHV